MTKKTFYNPETETTEQYSEVWKLELVKVRNKDDLVVRNHYWRDSDGELWVDFDHPMENVYRAFAAYRAAEGYMSPNEIRDLRGKLKMSVRKFADTLGIAPSSLTQIENNQRVQAKYQENLFEAARDSYEEHGQLPEEWLTSHKLADCSYHAENREFSYKTFGPEISKIKSYSKNVEIGEVA